MYNSFAKKVFLIPDGYKGCVSVLHNIKDVLPLKIEDKKIIYQVTKDGLLKTLSNERIGRESDLDSGWYNVEFYYVDKSGTQVKRLEEGKDIHNAAEISASGLQTLQFIVGTKKEAEEHSQFSFCFNEEQQWQIDQK